MDKKTKAELIELVEELEDKIERLENDVDYWQDEYNELEVQVEEANYIIENLEINGIKDINNFIWKLKLDNLYTKELEEFINIYVRCYNE